MRNLLTLVFLSTLLLPLSGQDYKKEEAKAYFFNQHYADALAVLKSAPELVRSDEEAKFIMSVCHYQLNELDAARPLLTRLIENSRSPYPECWLYMGKIYHAMHQFDKAASYYKGYLRRLKPNHPQRRMVYDAIRRCATGMRIQYQKGEVAVENLGPRVNTKGDEFAPIISPNFSNKLYFSAIREGNNGGARDENGMPDSRMGRHYSDMFTCRGAAGGGNWQEAEPMHFLLNSPRHDVLLDFSADGSVLYYFRGWSPDQGQIYVDTFKQQDNRRLSSDPYPGPVSASLGDFSPCFVNDTAVYFASRRPDGFGGLDIYYSALRDGEWTEPQNLGPDINTPYDEATPFVARDGITLYYSTNHPDYSIGGLDIVKSVFNQHSELWTSPETLPTPVNSAGDDAYFRISKDGFTAYFSSTRKDGHGQRDLYAAYFNSFLPEMELPVLAASYEDIPSRRVEPNINPEASNFAAQPAGDNEQPIVETVEVKKTNPQPQTAEPEINAEPEDAFTAWYLADAAAKLPAPAMQRLDRVAQQLKKTDGAHLIISAYHRDGEGRGERLFSGIQAAERAAQYLVSKGVDEKKLFLRASLSDQLPVGQLVGLDFAGFHLTETPGSLGLPEIGGQLPAAAAGHELNKNLLYKVQISSLRGAFKGDELDQYEHPMVETTLDFDYYRYTLGAFSSHQAASAYRGQLLQGPFRSALVTAYVYGHRVNGKVAKSFSNRFPDLANFYQ